MKIRRNDIFLLIIVLLLGCILLIISKLTIGENGKEVVITVNGKEYGTYSLACTTTIEIVNEYGTNVIAIDDGRVSVIDADCKDGICVATAAISRTNEQIVCLPHRLVIEVRGEADDMEKDIDTIAK